MSPQVAQVKSQFPIHSAVKELKLPAVIFTKQLVYKRPTYPIFKKSAIGFDYLKFVILDVSKASEKREVVEHRVFEQG